MPERPRITIDLNCDLGEGSGHDADLMPLVSSVNIACGGHAGNAESMARAVGLARQHGVAIGAHPGHLDREHFGRQELPITPSALEPLITGQVAALAAVLGEPPHHVKLHGALYHQVGRDPALAQAVVEAVASRWPRAIIVAAAGSSLVDAARQRGQPVAVEAFLDRAYQPDSSLVSRAEPGAVIADPREAGARAVRLAREGVVKATDGSLLELRPDTLCLHGDGADPVGFASAVRAALAAVGIAVLPLEPA
jgi:UPF0271 protein